MCELLCVGVLNPAPLEARTERFKSPDVALAIRGPGCPPGRLRRRCCGISCFVLFFCESFVTLAACEADRKSVVLGKSVRVRVDLGGRRIVNKNKEHIIATYLR